MLHIMVVDDEAPIRDWLVYCIQKCEAASSVTSAVNGEEAYRRILEQKPNVVFTDIRMPGMDGLELMSKVRDILPFTVFIILTNYAEFSYAKQAISLGAREYILKSEMRSSDIQRIVAEIAATTARSARKRCMMSSRTGWWTSTRCTAISNSPALWPPSGSGRGCGPASPIWPSVWPTTAAWTCGGRWWP